MTISTLLQSPESLCQAMRQAMAQPDMPETLAQLVDPLLKARHAAIAAFQSETDFPHPKEELWRFIAQHPLYAKPWQVVPSLEVVLEATDAFRLQGGRLLQLNTLETCGQLSSEHQAWVLQHLANDHHTGLSAHDTFWHLFSQASGHAPYVLILPDSLQSSHAVSLRVTLPNDLASSECLTVCPFRVLVLAENTHAHVHVTTQVHVASQSSVMDATPHVLVHGIVQGTLAAEASVAWLNQCHTFEPQCYWLTSTQVTLQEKARWHMLNLNTQAHWVRHGAEVHLQGEQADAKLCGLTLGQGSQKVHQQVKVSHHAVDTTSQQAFKQVMQHQAYAEFSGSIGVHRVAQGTDAQQLSNTILLSDKAKVFVRPWLQIDADDVKCSHGATVGQLENEQLFYLTSRGLTASEASKLLLQGFAHDIIDTYLLGQNLPEDVLSTLGGHLHTEVDIALSALVASGTP
jgi:hypothetical protein